jgi:small ligand-binding sensory domain FIST
MDRRQDRMDRAASLKVRPAGRVRRVRFGSAISEHPITAIATGEVTGAVLEAVGDHPSLAIVFVTPAHGGALEDVVRTVDEILCPDALLGAVAVSVVGPGREVERGAGISLWAASGLSVLGLNLGATPSPDYTRPDYTRPDDSGADDSGAGDMGAGEMGAGEMGAGDTFRGAVSTGGPPGVTGWPSGGDLPFDPAGLLLLADPFSFPVEDVLAWLDEHHRGLPVVGAMASAARLPGGNTLALGRKLQHSGAVGVLLGGEISMEPLVSQGSRPFGRPLVVTKAERNVIYELGGRPALERLVNQARSDLTDDEVEGLAEGSLQIGRVIDEHREQFTRGDFLIRNVLGTDRRTGAVAVGDVIPVGVTVQFHLRDASTADEDLSECLAGVRADAALLFTCTGRGTGMFGAPDHDAEAIVDHLGPIPTAGCFAAGEIGPVGGHNFLHGFTASIALFRQVPAPLPQDRETTTWRDRTELDGGEQTGDTVTS